MSEHVNIDDRTGEFDYVNAKEALRNMEVGILDLGEKSVGNSVVRMRIVDFPDLDGKPIAIPNYFEPLSPDIGQILESNALRVKEKILDETQKYRLKYCLEELKLPILLAVHLALNRPERSLQEFQKPEGGGSSAIIALVGYSGSGKSTIAATLALKLGLSVSSFDRFSKNTPADYLRYFNEKGLGKGSSYEQIVDAVRECRIKSKNGSGMVEKKKAALLGEVLDELVNSIKGIRKSTIAIVEGVAVRDLGDERTMNVYDLVSEQGTEGQLLIDTPPEYKKLSISAGKLEEAVKGFEESLPVLEDKAKVSRELFVSAVMDRL